MTLGDSLHKAYPEDDLSEVIKNSVTSCHPLHTHGISLFNGVVTFRP